MRTRNSILNFITAYGFYIVKLLLDLYRLSLFMQVYGQSTHALHQVYYNVFQCLSIVEGGIGAAVVFKLYKPLAENNHDEVNIIYSTLRKLFHYLGFFIIGASVIVSFALPFLIKDNPFQFSFLQLTFFIYVAREVVAYFMCSPQFVIMADHQKYKINIFIQGGLVVEQFAEIALIKLGVPYSIYLIPTFFIRIVVYLLIRKTVLKNYPWLKVVKERDKSLNKSVFNAFFINIFDLVHTNADVICLSALTNSFLVSIYSFYNYIVKFCYRTTDYLYESIKNGVGNVVVTSEKEVIQQEMKKNRVLFSFVAVVLCTLLYFSMSPFIGIWAGQDFVVDKVCLVLFLMVAYCKVMLSESKILVEVYGLFKEVKGGLLIAAALNIIISIVLIINLGLAGVLLGTVITDLGIVLLYYSYIGYKHLNQKYDIKYFIHHLYNILIMIVVIAIMSVVDVTRLIQPSGYVKWFVYSCINGIGVLGLDILAFSIVYKDTFGKIVANLFNTLKKMLFRKKVSA